MTPEEGRQALRHATGILRMEQVRRVRQYERLDIRQPGDQKFLSLAKNR